MSGADARVIGQSGKLSGKIRDKNNAELKMGRYEAMMVLLNDRAITVVKVHKGKESQLIGTDGKTELPYWECIRRGCEYRY